MKNVLFLFSVIATNSAFAVSSKVICSVAPSNEVVTLGLTLRPGTSSYEGKVKFKDSSHEFTVMSRPTGLSVGTNMGDTVVIADSQNSSTGTTIAIGSHSNPASYIKVSCKLN